MIILKKLGTFFFFSRRKHKKNDENTEDEHYKSSLLCRFVLDSLGKKVGESVAIEDDVIIIKDGGKYLGVPIKHIEENEKTLLVKGLFDQTKAEEMGEKWREKEFKNIDHL
jgi:hypothetical protein